MGIAFCSILISTNAGAEWWKRNLDQYSYNTVSYISSGHLIDVRCDLEKGYRHRVILDDSLDSKVRSFGYDDKAMHDVLYRVLSFQEQSEERDFASGVCRVEVLFDGKYDSFSYHAGNELFPQEPGNDLLTPKTGSETLLPLATGR
ncbi:hypothetical protein [Methylocystis bryophila]|uniref:hypothetical protein n=1 Tax=Methylocystis bryophila TaxID=655015 RepID=UPI00131A148E|nr:hypothetical protein [Methylocystis bryophila]